MIIIKQILTILLVVLITTAQNYDSSMNFSTQSIQKIINLAISKISPNGIIIEETENIYKSKVFIWRIGSVVDFPNQKFGLSINNTENGYLFQISNFTINTPISCYEYSSTNQQYRVFQILVNIDIQLDLKENGEIQLTKKMMKVDYREINFFVQSDNNDQNPIVKNMKVKLNQYIDKMILCVNDQWNISNNSIQFYNVPITFNLSFNEQIRIKDNQQQDFVFQININNLNDITKYLFDSQQLKGVIDNPNFPNQIQKALDGYNNFQIKIRFDKVPRCIIIKNKIIVSAENVVAELFSGTARIYKVIMSLRFLFEPLGVENKDIKIELKDGIVQQFITQYSSIKSIDKTIMRNFINSMIKLQIAKMNEFLLNEKYLLFNIFGMNFNDVSFKLIEPYLIIQSNIQI